MLICSLLKQVFIQNIIEYSNTTALGIFSYVIPNVYLFWLVAGSLFLFTTFVFLSTPKPTIWPQNNYQESRLDRYENKIPLSSNGYEDNTYYPPSDEDNTYYPPNDEDNTFRKVSRPERRKNERMAKKELTKRRKVFLLNL